MTIAPDRTDLACPPRLNPMYVAIRRLYRRHLESRLVLSLLARQRIKLLWFGWGYAPLLTVPALSLAQRLWLLWRCLRVDWNVPHAHEARDCSETIAALGARRARPGEVMIEAGCWLGGSSAKWSLACRLLGYQLHVYDSFQGVEQRTGVEGSYDFSGQYAAALAIVRNNVTRYGDASVCTFHPGWFCDTMQPGTVPGAVRLAYIDCDLVKGTLEVLRAVTPVLSTDGVIASQDGQIPVVAELLATPATWQELKLTVEGRRYSRHLLVFHRTSVASDRVLR